MGWKLKLCLGLILAVLSIIGGFYAIYGRPKLPLLRSLELSWGQVTPETTPILIQLELENPNPYRIPIKQLECKLRLNQVVLGTGEKQGFGIDPGLNRIRYRLELAHDAIPAGIVDFIRAGEFARLELSCEIAAGIWLLELRYPLRFSWDLSYPVLEKLKLAKQIRPRLGFLELEPIELEIISNSWSRAELASIQLISQIKAINHNRFPIRFDECNYQCHLDGMLEARGTSLQQILIPAMGIGEFSLVSELDPTQFKQLWMNHIINHERSELELGCGLDCRISYQLNDLEIGAELGYQYNHSIYLSTDLLGMLESKLMELIRSP